MLSLRQLRRGGTKHSATIARERLLKDRTLRRNRFQTSLHASTSPSPSPQPDHEEKHPSGENISRLSPRAQKWRIISIAQRFRGHYLAELAYNDLRNATTAIIRPYLVHVQAGEAPFEIRVNSQGHTTIIRLEEEIRSQTIFRFYHLFVALLILAALTSGALALLL